MPAADDIKKTVHDLVQGLDPMPHLKQLDFPHRAGSEGDRQAADYVTQALRDSGLEPVVQPFHYAKAKMWRKLILPLVLLLWAALSLLNIRFWDTNLLVSLLILTLPLALILALFNFEWLMKRGMTKRRKKLREVEAKLDEGTLKAKDVIGSQNVIVEIGPQDADQEILFTAHYDSISTKLPSRISMPCMLVGMIGFLLYSLSYLVNVFTALQGQNFIEAHFPFFALWTLVTLLLLEFALLARLFRSNDSHGVIDDGTGVAILLELAKVVQAHPLPAKFTFGFFGAEESGLIGSAYYYLHRTFGTRKPHVISVDMIGEKPPLAYVKGIFIAKKRLMDAAFNERIESLAEALDIEIKGKHFPYPGSDFGHFLLDGNCPTNWFISGSKLIHSRQDNLENVNPELVQQALTLLVAYLYA